MSSTENIVRFLQTSYSDEQLSVLLAHAQDGKLSYYSCCCVAGIPSASHALHAAGEYGEHFPEHPMNLLSNLGDMARAVSEEFYQLGYMEGGIHSPSDTVRRERLIPIIQAEMSRREGARISTSTESTKGELQPPCPTTR